MPLPSLTLVGPGRAGRALARSWIGAGGTLEAVVVRSGASAETVGALGHVPISRIADAVPIASEVLALAVPDDALASVAAAIVRVARCRFAFHLSGALPAAAIEPLSAAGASLASLHPLRAFRGGDDETLEGAFVAVEGDAEGSAAAERWAREMGARPHRISAPAKTLYHAGATLAAGGTVAVLSSAVRIWQRAGLPEGDARAALAGLAADAARGTAGAPFDEALTGPVARRDAGTVRAHLLALEVEPELRRLYVLLARETLERTRGRGREDEIQAMLA